jgi:hypothetical protein
VHSSSSGYLPTTDCVVVIHIPTVIWNVINKIIQKCLLHLWSCVCRNFSLSFVWAVYFFFQACF